MNHNFYTVILLLFLCACNHNPKEKETTIQNQSLSSHNGKEPETNVLLSREYPTKDNLFLDFYAGMNSVEVESSAKRLLKQDRLKLLENGISYINVIIDFSIESENPTSLFSKSGWIKDLAYNFSIGDKKFPTAVNFEYNTEGLLVAIRLVYPLSYLSIDQNAETNNHSYSDNIGFSDYEQQQKGIRHLSDMGERFHPILMNLYSSKYGEPMVSQFPKAYSVPFDENYLDGKRYPTKQYFFKTENKYITLYNASDEYFFPTIKYETSEAYNRAKLKAKNAVRAKRQMIRSKNNDTYSDI